MKSTISLHEIDRILYVGASVTAQKNGYRSALNMMLKENCNANIIETVVATGATGSLFALCNFSEIDVPHDHDLAILEYSTGDLNIGLTPLDMISNVIEDLIIKVGQYAKTIVIVHNYRSDFEGDKGDLVRKQYDEVAKKLSIPVINCAKKIESLKMEISESDFNGLYRDNVHTTTEGSEVVAMHIYEELNKIGKFSIFDRKITKEGNSFPRMYKFCDFIDLTVNAYIYPASQQTFPYITIEENEFIEFFIKGDLWGFVSIVGPKSGFVRIEVDGTQLIEYSHFDKHCYYTRVQPRILRKTFTDFSRMRIEVIKKEIDFSLCKEEHKDHLSPRQASFSMLMGKNIEIKNI